MRDIDRIVAALKVAEQCGVIVTIVATEGSSYRKPGAKMVFFADGSSVGILSGGCLEQDLQERVKACINSGIPDLFHYKTNEDDPIFWVDQSGCSGILTLLLEPVTDDVKQTLFSIYEHLLKGNRVSVYHDLKTLESWYVPDPHEDETIQEGLGLNEGIACYSYDPKPRLFVFGAGEDAIPVVQQAAEVGFRVTVIDWRPALCQNAHFPLADSIVCGFPREILLKLNIHSTDFIVLMTHHLDHDFEIIDYIMRNKVQYLGVLGSRKRIDRLFPNGVNQDYIYAPVGMPILADGPEEIAISIVAELILAYHKVQKSVEAQ